MGGELASLVMALGLEVSESAVAEAELLAGGVSSELWRVDTTSGPVVVKRACEQLRVAGDWRAPLERSLYEVAWMRHVAQQQPGFTPAVLAVAPDGHSFAMQYLDPATHRLWKSELLGERVDAAVAQQLGHRLGVVHASDDPALAAAFDNVELFSALRLSPYLDATATAHPDLADRIETLEGDYLAHRVALVHGDVSPKNVLVGPDGPVLLDAECATWGDPAFDLAFVSTHLLLKLLHRPNVARRLDDALVALLDAHAAAYGRTNDLDVQRRAAAMTGALLLARVDGLSPVEYLSDDERTVVRAAARALVAQPPADVDELRARWTGSITEPWSTSP